MEPQKMAPGSYTEPPPPYTMPPGSNYMVPPPAGGLVGGSPYFPGRAPHPPPPGGIPVFPMAGYPPQTTTQTIVMGAPTSGPVPVSGVTVVSVAQWGPYPMQISCPHCAAQVMTETNAAPGLLTWLLSGALIFLGCWIGCCLIPCCIPECQDIEHRCPNCKHHLGTYRRI